MYAVMEWLVRKEPQIHYREQRPMTDLTYPFEQELASRLDHGGSIYADCSDMATLVCKYAGLRDPNGAGYNGTGWSGQMFANLTDRYTDPARAGVGALVVFGPSGSHHVAMVMGPGRDPVLFSHGQERGPLRIRFSEERAAQPSPATFLSIAAL